MNTSDRFFPPLSPEAAQTVVTILKLVAGDAGYLLDEACPYPGDLKVAMRAVALVKADEVVEGMDKWDRLEHEAQQLFNSLKKTKINETGDMSDQMAYYRTMTSLLEKLVSLQERAAGLKQMSEFQNAIIQFLDELCTPDQRTNLMERLKKVQISDGGKRANQEEQPVDQANPKGDAAS